MQIDLQQGKTVSLEGINGLITQLESINDLSGRISSSYDTTISPALKEALSSGLSLSQQLQTLTDTLQTSMPQLYQILIYFT